MSVYKFINKIETDCRMVRPKEKMEREREKEQRVGRNFLRFYSFWCDIWYAVYVFWLFVDHWDCKTLHSSLKHVRDCNSNIKSWNFGYITNNTPTSKHFTHPFNVCECAIIYYIYIYNTMIVCDVMRCKYLFAIQRICITHCPNHMEWNQK